MGAIDKTYLAVGAAVVEGAEVVGGAEVAGGLEVVGGGAAVVEAGAWVVGAVVVVGEGVWLQPTIPRMRARLTRRQTITGILFITLTS